MDNMPNVLFLFSDQLRYDALGCSGNGIIKTPNIDSLARSGMRFENAYTPAPECIPARMSLITGRRSCETMRPSNSKIIGEAPELPTIMTRLHAKGYYTYGVGKTHFEGRNYGFIKVETQEENPYCAIDDDYLMYLRENGVKTRFIHGYRDILYYQPQKMSTPLKHSPCEWVADRTVNFLQDHVKYRKDKPFFLWSSYISPHPPFACCEPYSSMYEDADVKMPYDTDKKLEDMPYGAAAQRARMDGAHRDPVRMRRIKELYYGLVSQVDSCIGRTIDELKKLGIYDNTAIIFASDHGDMLGDHGLSQKSVPYLQSVKIPLIIKWPKVTRPSSVNTDIVSLLDMLPTFMEGLDAGGEDARGSLPGESLMPLLQGKHTFGRDEFFIDYGYEEKRWISVRSKKYMYAYWLAEGYQELYDLEADPMECRNIADENKIICEAFYSKISSWEKRNGFESSFENGRLKKIGIFKRPSEEECRNVVINQSQWPELLPEIEKDTVESYQAAFNIAVSDEKSVSKDKLSVDIFTGKGGSLKGTAWDDGIYNGRDK